MVMIRATDRVSRVLERDESLLEVFTSASPHFERLRDPHLRRVMAGLVTVAAAARIAGLNETELVRRLNAALKNGKEEATTPEPAPAGLAETEAPDGMPAALAALPPERIVDLDVREDLRNGQEPFARIMDARRTLADGQALRLRAIFEPVPLYHVFGKQGFEHWTERLADDDWRVWFHRGGAAVEASDAGAVADSSAVPAEGGAGDGAGEDVVVLDVRGLDPPEPMVRTLAALESLPAGATLVQLNVRAPQFLLPRLDELGFTYEIREQSPDLVRVFIRRREAR